MTRDGATSQNAQRVAWYAASAAFVFHALANPHYGFFRDELYFILCGRHPQWGYVDQPPVVPILAALSQVFGHSLVALRIVPAWFAAGCAWVTCALAFELGGGVFAAVLACVGATLCPVLAAFAMKQGPDMVGLWLWPLCALWLVRMAKGGDLRQWLLVGLALGVCLQSKYSVLYFAVALLIGLLATPQRRLLATRWCVVGTALALLIALPNVVWQAAHRFPMWELLQNGQHGKNVVLSPLQFLAAELLVTNPVLALLWLCGLVRLALLPFARFLAIAYLVVIALMIASHAKHYYPADVYPILFAAGATAIERWTSRRPVLRPIALAVAIVAALPLLPYVEPLLSEPRFVQYNAAVGPRIGIGAAATERTRQSVMTQDWADMHGWPELAASVERVYDALPSNERAEAVAVASNYGEASAIAFFSDVPVVSGHNQFFLWGPRGYSGDVILDVGGDCGASQHLFRSVRRAAVFSHPYVMPYENDLPIMLCRGIRTPLATVWPQLKKYI